MEQDIHRSRLFRTRDSYAAGVAGGVARRFDVDPALIRIAWLASVLFWGLGLGLYLVLWWLMPREGRVPLEPPHGGRLERAGVDRKIAGVFGGIASHYQQDPTVVRFVGVVLMGASFGLFVLAYLLAAIFIPQRAGVIVTTE